MKSLRLNKVHFLMTCLIFSVTYLTPIQAVTDAELEALEKQIEQQELEEKKLIEEKQVEEKRKKAEAKRRIQIEQNKKRLAEQERKRLEEKRLDDAARLAEREQNQKEELKKKYSLIIIEADQALSNKDKNLAIKKYNEALALIPGDVLATLGLKNAEKLKHKVCYDVLGKWLWDKTIGQEFIILHDNGSIDYQTSAKGSGSWECTSPETRTIKIRISMAGFSNEWLSTYSADGRCLLGPETWGERGCYHRPESDIKNLRSVPEKN